nr:Chain A, NuxVA [Conus nux]
GCCPAPLTCHCVIY